MRRDAPRKKGKLRCLIRRYSSPAPTCLAVRISKDSFILRGRSSKSSAGTLTLRTMSGYHRLSRHKRKRQSADSRQLLQFLRRKQRRSSAREPFLSFSKAYLRYMHGLRPKKFIAGRLYAVKAVASSLHQEFGSADVGCVTGHVFDVAAGIIKQRYVDGLAYRIGGELELLANFLSENGFTAVPVRWRNILRRPSGNDRVGKEFDERRASKLPSAAVLEALPKAFHAAKEPADILVTSVTAILLAAPGRISEVLMLPANCEVTNKTAMDTRVLLRWWPSKGGTPMLKPLCSGVSDVVVSAVANLKRVTEPARVIAAWYEAYPKQLFLPPGTEMLRGRTHITLEQVSLIVGVRAAHNWCEQQGIGNFKIEGQGLVCVKGDHVRNAPVKRQLEESRRLLRSAEAADLGSNFGADRWAVHHRGTAERLEQLCSILDDPLIPIGNSAGVGNWQMHPNFASPTGEDLNSKRSRNLREEDVQAIVGLLDGWSGPLTWNLLIDAVRCRLHAKYTRQALHKREPIKTAFEVRKQNVDSAEPKYRGSAQVQKALERIARLEAENQRLTAENGRLLEQFARWAFNAYVRGLGEAELNRSLPEIDRRQTPVLVRSAPRNKRI